MRRWILCIMTVLALCLFAACENFGQAGPGKAPSEGLEFTLNSNGASYTVSGIGSCTDTDVVIPATYNGKPVTGIGESAFAECTSLTSIGIPGSVTSIGNRAFSGCSSLRSITIPNSVTSIGNFAFDSCSSLTSVTIGNGVTSIGYGAFADCSSLTSVTIPSSVTSIGNFAFAYCSSLTSVTIPSSVTSIGDWAFDGCYKLVEVYNLSDLNITVGSSDNGYAGYYALVIHTSADEPSYISETEDGYLFYENGDDRYLIGYCGTDTAWTLPKSRNSKSYEIYDYAFSYCRSLTSITIPDSVTSIGDYAFYECSSLTSVTIGNGVTSIDDNAFAWCTSLESITVDEGNEFYHSTDNCLIETATNTLIAGCKNSVIPTDGTVTGIGDEAFAGCQDLTSITIPDSVTSIGDYAFYECSSLTSITIPSSVTSIGGAAFQYCSSLTSITIPDSVTSIGSLAFSSCTSLTSITFNGTKEQWNAIKKGYGWNWGTGAYTIHCTDGDIPKE